MQKKNEWLINHSVLQKTLYFQSNNGFSLMIIKNRRQEMLDIPLIHLENMLPAGIFFRVHRSYLVNMNAISEFRYYRNQFFAVVNEYKIPVSRRRRKLLMDNLDFI